MAAAASSISGTGVKYISGTGVKYISGTGVKYISGTGVKYSHQLQPKLPIEGLEARD
jgi:hypothetical protein